MPTKKNRSKSAKLILRELMLEKLNSPRMHKYLEKREPGCTKFFDSLDEDEKLELIDQVDKPIGEAVYDFFYSVNNWSGIVHGYMYGIAGLRRRLKDVMTTKEDLKDIDEFYEKYKREEKSLVETIEYVEKKLGKQQLKSLDQYIIAVNKLLVYLRPRGLSASRLFLSLLTPSSQV